MLFRLFQSIKLVVLFLIFPLVASAVAPAQYADSVLTQIKGQDMPAARESYLNLCNYLFNDNENDSLLLFPVIRQFRNFAESNNDVHSVSQSHLLEINSYFKLIDYEKVRSLASSVYNYLEKNKEYEIFSKIAEKEIDSYLLSGKYEEAIDITNTLYERAKSWDSEIGVYTAYFKLGLIYSVMGRLDQADKYFCKVEQYLGKNSTMPFFSNSFYFRYVTALTNMNRLDDALKMALRWESMLEKDIKENPSKSYYFEKFQLYIKIIEVASQLNNNDLATEYIAKVEPLLANASPVLLKLYYNSLSFYYDSVEDYTNAIAMIDSCIVMSRRDGNIESELIYIYGKAWDLRLAGRFEEASALLMEMITRKDSLRNERFAHQLDEVNAKYNVDILEMERDRANLRVGLWMSGCAFLIILIVVYTFYLRRLHRTNRVLYNKVQESLRSQRESDKLIKTVAEEVLTKDMRIVRDLTELMDCEMLFLQPGLKKKDVAMRLGVNELYLGNAVRNEKGVVFTDYLNNLRLRYAAEMMNAQPETSVEQIAYESGFASYSAFYRSFQKEFAMSPSEFRRISAA